MGNTNSSEETEEQSLQQSEHVGKDSTTAEENLLDFSSLFQPEDLYKALLAIKEPPGSALSRNKNGMVQWLSSLADNDEHSVNMVQVVEHLTGKGVSKEEALEFFSEVDRDEEGQVDVAYLLLVLKDRAVDPMQALVPCHILPGPVEVYLPERCSQSKAGRKLVQFLQTRRVEPGSLVVGCMSQIVNHQLTREKLVQGRYQMFLIKEDDNPFLAEEGGSIGSDLQERVVVTKCYSTIESSSSQHQIKNMTDNRTDTYWQSSGSPRSHWIRLRMLPGMTVRDLAVTVDSRDESYMPRTIVVSVGSTEKNLSDIKTVHVPRDKTGYVVLAKNLGRVYQYVQISIRNCHSDGCDVKIRGLHIKGSKVQEEKQPSVLDTMVMWYIRLLASTAKAAIPAAPQLSDIIIGHSRSALKVLQPLVLSQTSAARPEFLTSFVVQEMENMLKSLSIPDENCDLVPTESLEILLAFSIAHGNVNSILDCLFILLDYQNVDLNVQNLLLKMEDIKQSKYLNHAEALQLTVTKCTGGHKDENHKPDNIVSNDISNSSATPYVSSSGHRTATVVLREKDNKIFSPTRLVVHVPSASNAATSCLFFLLEQEPDQAWLEELSAYEGWGKEDYSKCLEGVDESGLIALLEFSKEMHQVDMAPDVSKRGRALVVMMSASGEEVEDVAMQALGVFGHCLTADKQQITPSLEDLDAIAPLPSEMGVAGGVVLCRVLVFLSVLLQDLSDLMDRRRLASLEPSLITEPHLSVEGLSLERIWRIYTVLSSKSGHEYPALLVLGLLRSALPFIKPEKTALQVSSGATVLTDSNSSGGDTVLSSTILSHLCTLLDAEEDRQEQSAIQCLVQEIVVKGVVVFFPDATARKEYLLAMIESVLSEKQPRSWWLKFEALCKYFSKSDANSLLGLPSQLKKEEVIETGRALELLTTMLTVATRESLLGLSSGKPRPNDLVSLLCALQASLFYWCRRNMSEKSAQKLLLDYVENLVTKSTRILNEITAVVKDKEKLKVLDNSVLTRTLAEMLVFLPTITKSPIDRPRLLNAFYPLVPALRAATFCCSGVFLTLADTSSLGEQTESVVGVWTRESSHNYENNARTSEEFVCPSATKFVVEFDSRCITERRYDYLEFTDATGAKHKFDGKYNSDRWPRTAEFPGQKLQFSFHSDGSNNEWGYLFTLKAFGEPAPSLHWLFDLQLSIARLLGQLTSVTLSMKILYTQLPEQQREEQKEELLLTRSDLWRTLFRGGYMPGKLTRSLSGAHMASPADCHLNSLLQDVATGSEGEGKQLLDSLREKGKGPYYGGEQVDQAVNAVFAALIWHCQDLREELATRCAPSQLLQDAFSTAEGLRRELVEMRQKILEAKEKEEKNEINEDSPLISCRDKAIFLLKFAGLSRVVRDGEKEEEEGVDGHKVSNAVNTVSRLKQQLSLGGQAKPRKKPVSFDLVLSFVKNEAATADKVHHLLLERERLASWAAQAYTFAANYLSAVTIDNMFELPGLVFLQQLISSQRHFPMHYAAKLDGCGLELENQVRKAYHFLLKQLLEGLAIFSKPPTKEYSRARLLVGIVTCHLLDFQWQEYDNHLLGDLQLSDFLLQSVIRTTHSEEKKCVEKFDDEEAMLARYAIHTALLEKLKGLGGEDVKKLEELELYSNNKWEGDLFITAKNWSSSIVQCDSCQSLVRDGIFYHNMELKSTSFDLCPRCFKSGSGSRPDDHTADQLYLAMGHFYCHNCKLCIMSHRFHSNTRDNVDLCLGCFRKEEGNSSTDSSNWTVYLLTEVPASGSANRYMTSDPGPSKPLLYQDGCITCVEPALDLMVYHQQHCWLLFTALCLNMADCLNAKHSTSQDYKSQACHNLLQCLGQLASILHTAVQARWEEQASKTADVTEKQKSEEQAKVREEDRDDAETAPEKEGGGSTAVDGKEEANEDQIQTTSAPVAMEIETTPVDLIAKASRLQCQKEPQATSMEKAFASLSINRTLCTLAAVLPQDMSLSTWCEGEDEDVERTITTQLLPALLEVAACSALQPLSCNLAHIVTAQYMARVDPQVADRSIEIACDLSPTESLQQCAGGSLTTRLYFSLGARFLHRSDFSGAATIAECLLILSKSPTWEDAVSQSILSPLTTKAEEMDLTSIFGLLVLAGFPKLHREGSLVKVHSRDSDHRQQQHLSVLTSVQGESGTVASCEHREPQSVKLSCCEVEDTLRGCITCSQLPSLLPLLHRSIHLAKQENDRQIETTWVLALTLKALLALLKGPGSREAVEAVLKEKLLPEVGRLACKATRLTQKWLASDLEVVAIRGYQPVGKRGTEQSEETESGGKEEGEVTVAASDCADKEDKSEEEKQASVKAEEACLEGLSDEIQDMLVIMQEAFQCPLTTLRALFDASGADVNQFILSSEQYYDMESATLKPPDHILEAAAKWETDMNSEVKDIQDSLEDTGVTRLVPVPFSPSSLEAEPEKADILKRPKSLQLIQEEGRHEKKEHKEETSCEDSFQLLQEQLKEGVASRKQLLKIQQAIVVLYARHVLAALLSHWPPPPHPLFSTSLLGTMDIMQLFCLLDLLVKPLDQETCCELLRAVVHFTEPTQLVQLAVTASECMRKVSVGVEKKQFKHPTQGSSEEKGKIVIANASSMSVVFHQTRGEVELASKDDFCEHHKIVSSSETNTQKEITHLIPGNTVYYRVKLEAVKEAKHPCCTLCVTGTQMGRFSTGLKFLEQLLSEAVAEEGEVLVGSLPLAQLWPNLIAVACHHTGNERLKVICLLLHLLVIMKNSTLELRPNLSALKPLWQFYTTLMKDYETRNRSQQVIAPQILRALTELFLAVENQAEEWGVSQAMVIETLTKEGLGTWLEKGINNVAFLSLGLGLDNIASKAFTEAKRSYVPPVEENEREDEEEKEGGGDDSSDDTSHSPSESENSFYSDES